MLSVPSIRGKPLQFCSFLTSHKFLQLSVPSIRGKPLQLDNSFFVICLVIPFSPLHSGQATAITFHVLSLHDGYIFQSPPFGASNCTGSSISRTYQECHFQSPPFGASHCNVRIKLSEHYGKESFSPLHSGQATAMVRATRSIAPNFLFQSPPFGASHCN